MFFRKFNSFVAALLVVALLIGSVSFALAADYPFAATLKTSGTLRKAASESSVVLAVLPAGDAVYVTGESGNYYIVEYDGASGYLLKNAVNSSAPSANQPTEAQAARYATLAQGSEGQLVRDLQSALIELGYLSGSADGKYGAKTAKAVTDFQAANGLNATGSADAATQGLLYEGKPINSKGKAKSVSIAPDIAGFPISSGRTGTLVTKIQTALKALEYYSGKVDGKFGSGSVKAVKNFQKKNGLTVSGIADAATQAVLFSGEAIGAKTTPTPKPTATPVPPVIGWENGVQTGNVATYPYETVTTDSVNLRKGASTSTTRILTVPKGASVTVLALKGDFLQINYVKSKKTYTGYVMARYVDVPAVYLGGKELDSDADAQKLYTSLSSGSAADSVSVLQDALRELGFYTSASSGIYDAKTIAAVKAFQAKNGLLQTGIASAELQKFLFEGTPLNSKGKKTDVSVLPPYSGVTMRQGDTGWQVTELQQALRQLGYVDAAVTGVYDANTVKAVKAFQKANSMTQDGIAGTKVLTALTAYLTTPTPAPVLITPTPTAITPENVVVLHRGTRGLAVTRLQERLVALGYYAITPDGIYDANDIAAVREFQKKNGLTSDGVAGLETQLKLYSDYAVAAWATPTPKPTATPKPQATPSPSLDIVLKLGSKGAEVNILQARLTTLNYFSETIDGLYGTKTAAAVAAFQQNNSLTADGIAGPKTLKKLYGTSPKAATVANPAAEEDTEPVQSTTLRIGDTGSAVKAMQQKLIDLGYLTGAADGIFGPKTYLAVKAFQKANKLSTDGVVGSATQSRLNALVQQGTSTSSTAPAAQNNSTSVSFKAPAAIEVRFADWYTETRTLAKLMPNAIVYDYRTGLYYNVNMFSFGKHCDAEPLTASDTAVMQQIMGVDNWTPHAVWVILSDGKVYMASTHSHGHEIDHNSSNGLEGHICIHFPREMTEAEKASMPYALSHQLEILRGWEETQSMIH